MLVRFRKLEFMALGRFIDVVNLVGSWFFKTVECVLDNSLKQTDFPVGEPLEFSCPSTTLPPIEKCQLMGCETLFDRTPGIQDAA
jgi:hypothetical protein